mmetsp:Transcript_72762/g.213236  ORF Transcript_72762/g.213236 Transcript_72762/m.213236 type:complete len:290 (-) Transcript_72762:184-1053(-)
MVLGSPGCRGMPSLLLQDTRDAADEDEAEECICRVPLQESEEHLCIGRHKLPSHQSNAHDQRSHSGGPHIVHWLEVLGEGQLPVLGLQGVATPLVPGRGDDARQRDGEAERERVAQGAGRVDQGNDLRAAEAARPAVHDVARHRGHIRLVEQAELDLPAHALAEAVVRHRQHHGAEEQAVDDAARGAGQGREGEEHVDDLEGGELQHVGGEGSQEEVGDEGEVDLLERLAEGHALHQQAVHEGLRAGREHGSHESRRSTLRRCADDLRDEGGLHEARVFTGDGNDRKTR